MDFSKKVIEKLPRSHIDYLIKELGRDRATKIANEWAETATGTSSFPRIDKATLTLGMVKHPFNDA